MSKMSIKEFVEQGYLLEVNRKFFHPLGLALAVEIDDNNEYALEGIQDFRSDPEGIVFDDVIMQDKDRIALADKIEEQRRIKEIHRLNSLGFSIQPFKKLVDPVEEKQLINCPICKSEVEKYGDACWNCGVVVKEKEKSDCLGKSICGGCDPRCEAY